MRKKIKYSFFIVVVIIILLALATILRPINHQGALEKELIIKAYLNNLTNNDSQAILELTPSDYESRKAVQQVIKNYGGNEFKNIKTKYIQSSKTKLLFAQIIGLRMDKMRKSYLYKDQLTIEERNNKWFLLLGEQKSSLPRISDPPIKIR